MVFCASLVNHQELIFSLNESIGELICFGTLDLRVNQVKTVHLFFFFSYFSSVFLSIFMGCFVCSELNILESGVSGGKISLGDPELLCEMIPLLPCKAVNPRRGKQSR